MRILIAAGALFALAPAAFAQTQTGGSSAQTPRTGDVFAGTSGSGTSTPDSVAVEGSADAQAAAGGTAATRGDARFNDNNARQRSVAVARDDDERARSRTQTMVRKDGDVRSRSMSIYKQRGEKPVIERETTVNGVPR